MTAEWESLFDGSLTLTDAHTESDAFAALPARRGVLLFTDADNQPIQLVQTANLRTLSRSRLTEVPAALRRKADLVKITRHLHYVCCDNDLERHFAYQRLCHAVFGSDWKQWLSLPRRDYAAIDLSKPFACFSITGQVEASSKIDIFGPFPSRRAAGHFCECLNTAFELCRNPAFPETGKAQSCPYRQMQSCHGLCCQEHGQTAYAQRIQKAIRCAEGDVAGSLSRIEQEMKQEATSLNFEAAQLRKKQADRLRDVLHPDFEWTGRLAALRILFIGHGPKMAPQGAKKRVPHYQFWRLDSESVRLSGVFAHGDGERLGALLADFEADAPPVPYARSRQEHLAAIGYFLYRKSRPGIWYNLAKGSPEPQQILSLLDIENRSLSQSDDL